MLKITSIRPVVSMLYTHEHTNLQLISILTGIPGIFTCDNTNCRDKFWWNKNHTCLGIFSSAQSI